MALVTNIVMFWCRGFKSRLGQTDFFCQWHLFIGTAAWSEYKALDTFPFSLLLSTKQRDIWFIREAASVKLELRFQLLYPIFGEIWELTAFTTIRHETFDLLNTSSEQRHVNPTVITVDFYSKKSSTDPDFARWRSGRVALSLYLCVLRVQTNASINGSDWSVSNRGWWEERRDKKGRGMEKKKR